MMNEFANFLNATFTPLRVYKYAIAYFSLSGANIRAAPRKNIIVDTDIFSDVDDAAALLLAATLEDTNLLAVNVNVNSTYSAIAASAIVNHYGYPNLPIGLRRPYTNSSFFDTWKYKVGEYASKVGYHYSGGSVPWFDPEKTWDPITLYRKSLAEADDHSVSIASIGFFENLSGLLNSTSDKYSHLDGYGLVERKVKELVVMGGQYPAGHEFNFFGDNPITTAHVTVPYIKSVCSTSAQPPTPTLREISSYNQPRVTLCLRGLLAQKLAEIAGAEESF
ncbi:nucleoside hydrolase [Amniculicola lignicola CBS 123094]|uniref:Nucleoside hydrolase n=1 Tax=Amniculicola lignicola CBS 123094 TaxID=1392246 RepID=A0A6A5WHZ2_9PLEO|nr:nucleoside hydrolase [Amniculicola lignicola CBS 123094]